MVQQQNYMSPDMFKKFIEVMPRLPVFHMDLQKPPVTPYELQMLAKIQYGCALRIGEALTLHVEDLNLETRIATLRRTKTGIRKCSKCKGKDNSCKKCDGTGKIRINQFTTIPIWLVDSLRPFLSYKTGRIFNASRQAVSDYFKSAGYMANLEIYEMQTEREVFGVWTHLLRKSYSKWMQEQGASRELRMVKLRHANKDAHDAYDRPDINAVLQWEESNPMLIGEKK
jgi:integrase